ncbi:hypothetical protein COCNU_03G003300 [Cocos nucifera]|uniref:Uncharacterized protein n=1 Tax=Cocos nucifera TaxID=13894 RepID=A0A8K0MYP7_COCNU|nr:hypothetical protein COCNU_03G003300 [Cocos nucifera]
MECYQTAHHLAPLRLILGKGNGEAEKRRRIVVVEEDGTYDGAGSLALKLGGACLSYHRA